MRQIKFRAWDFKRKEMSYDLRLQKGNDNLNETFRRYGDLVMQFTELKDKNGKEIYEQDIVNCNILPLKGTNHKAKIEFIDGCFFVLMESGTQFPICTNDYFLEVIGNTYENPKLLDNIKTEVKK